MVHVQIARIPCKELTKIKKSKKFEKSKKKKLKDEKSINCFYNFSTFQDGVPWQTYEGLAAHTEFEYQERSGSS